MRNVARLAILLWSCMLLLWMSVPTPAQGAEITYYSPYPQGEVSVSDPIIGWSVHIQGVAVRKAQMFLDGQEVAVRYDEERRAYVYRPGKLNAGEHQVELRLELENGYAPIEKKWRFRVAADARAVADRTSEEALQAADEARQLANHYRLRLGLPLWETDLALMAAAIGHAQYLSANKRLSHEQEEGLEGFTGVTAEERAKRAGYFGSVAENLVEQPSPMAREAIDGLFDAPYHRIPFLMPQARDWGYAHSGRYFVMNVGLWPLDKVREVHYPVEGEDGVPMLWNGNEVPDPLRLHQGIRYPVGYPIMWGLYGEGVTEMQVLAARLRDEEGQDWPLLVNDPSTDSHLRQEVILIPRDPLKPGTTYTVDLHVGYKLDGEARETERQWSFTTELRRGSGKEALHQEPTPQLLSIAGIDDRGLTVGYDFVSFWTDLPWLKKLNGDMEMVPLLKGKSFPQWLTRLDGKWGWSWDEEKGRLSWKVGKFELEWRFWRAE